MNSAVIMQLCQNLTDEIKAISGYTQAISLVEDETAKALFTEIRNDELNHAQKLLVALSDVLLGDVPEEVAQNDDDNGEGGATQ